MQDRTEWKQVKAHLAEARAKLDAGEPDRALEAVDRALAIDPNYLAATALRQRITTAQWAPVPLPSVPAARSSTNLAGLEERARQRRIEHRAQTARTAIAERQWGEARAALDELQELNPDLPELPALVADYTRADRSAHAIPASTSWIVATALILAGGAFALSWTATKAIHPRGPRAEPATLASNAYTLGDVPLVEALPSTLDASSEVALDPTPIAPTPDPIQTPPQLLAPVSTSAAAPLPGPTASPPAVAAPVRNAAAAPASPPIAPVPIAPATIAPVTNAPGTIAPVTPAPATPVPRSAPPVRDDESLIRDTLQRYRSAYENLDAQAARDVWPEVDEPALERAFEGLESQRLSFDECSVDVHGSVATAACSGSARYTPRVGSREPRVEARVWNFTLRKVAEAWQIDAARVGR